MKLMAMIVLYNPDINAINNYENLKKSKYFDKVYVYDNSIDSSILIMDEHIEYETCNKNMGIAYALKNGLNYAVKNGYDYVLTLDQDSIFNFDEMPQIIKYLESFVPIPKRSGNTPVAFGSNVPVCPTFFTFNIFLTFATTSCDV